MIECRLVIPHDFDRRFNDRVALEAAGRGAFNLVKRHLVKRNLSRPKRGDFPHSGYWAKRKVSSRVSGTAAVVEVGAPGDGVALHYYGGTVRPRAGRKYLAIPQDRSVWNVKPSEYRGKLFMKRKKGAKSGVICDRKTGKTLWLLVPKATIKADKTVLPEMSEIVVAAQKAATAAVQGGAR